ncbi:hypothetical protein [Polaribacter sp. IC073]|uniref:hypothetical protein n=1 Tax=Polaribacter sp. IC073 TaxID=2508540 RepID=UPI0011BED4DF|nr:hypothetical protein [Polaribacter sp. IC073]TXD49436.1 hypothetical protein ES045_05065 [Polaribacter sp. IC073]
MNTFVIIISGVIGAILTFYVSRKFKQSAVRSSALLSLVVGLVFYCFPEILNPYLTKNIPMVFLGTSFIGMVSLEAYGNYLRLALAGIIFSSIYINKSHFFEGFGGALGALAFISLLTIMGVSDFLLKNIKIKNSLLKIRKKFLNKKINNNKSLQSSSKNLLS